MCVSVRGVCVSVRGGCVCVREEHVCVSVVCVHFWGVLSEFIDSSFNPNSSK